MTQSNARSSTKAAATGQRPPERSDENFASAGAGQGGRDDLLGRIRRAYNYSIIVLACLIMALITIIMGTEVVFRYVFNSSIIWSEEVCRYLLIWGTFLFAGAAFQNGEMIAVEFFIERVNYYVGLILSIVGYLLVITLLLLLVYHGYRHAQLNDIQTIPALDFISTSLFGRPAGVSIFWIYIALPVGCALLAVHFLFAVIDKILRLFRRRDAVDISWSALPIRNDPFDGGA